MNVRKLGRGLDVLLQQARKPQHDQLPSQGEGPPAGSQTEAEAPGAGIVQLPTEGLQPNPYQPRRTFDPSELETLKSSIAREGVLQPLLVRKTASGHQLIAGERRWRAAQEAGLKQVPAIEMEVPDERLLEVALIENIHREDLNPIETAKAFKQLLELKGWTQEMLAQNLGLGRPTVSNHLRLLDLPGNIQNALARRQIQMGHAKVLLSVTDPQDQYRLFEKIAEDRLSVRDLEIAREAVPDAPRKAGEPAARKRRVKTAKGSNLLDLEDELSRALRTKVTIHEKKGKGVIRIEFYSPEDFEALREMFLERLAR